MGFITVGILMILIINIIYASITSKSKRCTASVIGILYDLDVSRVANGICIQTGSNNNGLKYTPVYKAYINCNEVVFVSSISSDNNKQSKNIDKEVEIHYNPSNLKEFYVESDMTTITKLRNIISISGVAAIVIGFIFDIALFM